MSGPLHEKPAAGPAEQMLLDVPLWLDVPQALQSGEAVPLRNGVPLPRGVMHGIGPLCLCEQSGARRLPVQAEALQRWPDGSVQWLLIDALVYDIPVGRSRWVLRAVASEGNTASDASNVGIQRGGDGYMLDTGALRVEIDRGPLRVKLSRAHKNGGAAIPEAVLRGEWRDPSGRVLQPHIDRVLLETAGPIRATLCLEGSVESLAELRFRTRLSVFAGSPSMHVEATLHNAQRAQHRGGLWDLGDRGSVFFDEFALVVDLAAPAKTIHYGLKPEGEVRRRPTNDGMCIYQDSSGGENWQSPNHANREGRVPCRFRGYHVTSARSETPLATGDRAEPTVAVASEGFRVTASILEFWQQFPKAIEANADEVRLGLFPRHWDDVFELQGGEQKRHAVWIDLDSPSHEPMPLTWVHRPPHLVLPPEVVADSGAVARFLPADAEAAADARTPQSPLVQIMQTALTGERSLPAGRETIDEYGWRNFGEIWADHEGHPDYYHGPQPIISHYNNQFDVILGTILAQLRTGDVAWREIYAPLSRHVIDIDIYHTQRDRAAYNGGLFWFTDHYLTAHTCTHRTYSRHNRPADGSPYGGGPNAQHNFTTGLRFYYCLTGDREARDAVLSLADWVIDMDDGAKTLLGLVDDRPTGLASATAEMDYHGPGRGAGNSINALLDAWRLTDKPHYLAKAEALVRRCVHPDDDIEALDLLNAEHRWSYTVFLTSLARYLDEKIAHGQNDAMYAYARASLLHYAEWMVQHEQPYLDRPEALEYPTETWAAQELRKANVMRLAARFAEPPLREKCIERGRQLANRAWRDLLESSTFHYARPVAVALVEGANDAFFRTQNGPEAPAAVNLVWPEKEPILSQRTRVRRRASDIRGALALSGKLLRTFWGRFRAGATVKMRDWLRP